MPYPRPNPINNLVLSILKGLIKPHTPVNQLRLESKVKYELFDFNYKMNPFDKKDTVEIELSILQHEALSKYLSIPFTKYVLNILITVHLLFNGYS